MAKNEGAYTYSITVHSTADVLARLEEGDEGAGAEETPVIYCDSEGACMFDDPSRKYLRALESILNQAAGGGRRLVQILFRSQQMIAIWEHRGGENRN